MTFSFSIFLLFPLPTLLSPFLERKWGQLATPEERRGHLLDKFLIFWYHSGVSELIPEDEVEGFREGAENKSCPSGCLAVCLNLLYLLN